MLDQVKTKNKINKNYYYGIYLSSIFYTKILLLQMCPVIKKKFTI